jgi:hypothetical protein
MDLATHLNVFSPIILGKWKEFEQKVQDLDSKSVDSYRLESAAGLDGLFFFMKGEPQTSAFTSSLVEKRSGQAVVFSPDAEKRIHLACAQ